MSGVDRDMCRKAAAECIELARSTSDPAKKEILLTRAQEWQAGLREQRYRVRETDCATQSGPDDWRPGAAPADAAAAGAAAPIQDDAQWRSRQYLLEPVRRAAFAGA